MWLLVAGSLVLGLGVLAGFACRAFKDGWILIVGISLFIAGLVFGTALVYKALTWLVFFRLKGVPLFSVHPGGIHILGNTSRFLSWHDIRTAEVREDAQAARLVIALHDETTCTLDLGGDQFNGLDTNESASISWKKTISPCRW